MFPNKAGHPINAQNMMTREYYPALKRAGLRRIRFHDLRHTYGAMLVSLGINIKFIQHQLGHASITTSLDLYGHLLPDVSTGVGEKLDALIFTEKPDLDSSTEES